MLIRVSTEIFRVIKPKFNGIISQKKGGVKKKMQKRLLKIREAADFLGICENTVRNLIKKEIIQAIDLNAGKTLRPLIRIPVTDLERIARNG